MTLRTPYFSLFILSGGALAYEILLMRLFSIIQWHHFAYMIIGLALLGYSISGAVVTIYQQRFIRHFEVWYISSIILFSVTALLCFFVAQQMPFNAEVILWDNKQMLYLGIIFLLLAIPFFFAASAICLILMTFGKQVSRLYAMDLLGAGVGSLTSIVLLYLLFPLSAILAISIVALVAGMLAMLELGKLSHRYLWSGIVAGFCVVIILHNNLQLNLSPYKGLPQLLQVSGTKILKQYNSPLGLIHVVESNVIPLRHAPGMSLNAQEEPLPQLAVFTDGDNLTVLTKKPDHREQLAYLDQMTSALPYHLRRVESVLILGAGGGGDVLQAQYHQVSEIDGVELNSQLIQLVNNDFGEFTGSLYKQQGVNIYQTEIRDYLSRSTKNYDLIQLALVDTFNASSSGLYALNESYLYTVEALQKYLSSLNDNGYIAISRWIKLPPRDNLKLFASIIEAMQKKEIEEPEKNVIMIRGWQTSTLLVKNSYFNKEEIAAVRNFCRLRSFDLVYLPDMNSSEVNRYNLLSSPVFYESVQSILGKQRESFYEQYKFNLKPAKDDRPYFHQFFKWSTFKEILSLRDKGGMPLIEWGYITLITTLGISGFLSLFLIVIPVWSMRRKRFQQLNKIPGSKILLYFFAIGIAFLFIEIAMIQKFTLFLHHPVYSIAVTLTAFLVFSGIGSAWSGRLQHKFSRRRVLLIAISSIVFLISLYVFVQPVLFDWLMGIAVWQKVIVSLILIAPLAMFMGMPFPLALGSLAENATEYIPWAWAINGSASVISAVLATILAIHFGFFMVLFFAVLTYLITLLVFPEPPLSHR